MNADSLVQDLSVRIYEAPLSSVRKETDYPSLDNPLHLTVLFVDCNTEIEINGVLGFLENSTGRYLPELIEALDMIGAPKCAATFRSIQTCMTKHGVSWEQLRGDFDDTEEFQIASFRDLHGKQLDLFTTEVNKIAEGCISLFDSPDSPEDVYRALCDYLDDRLAELQQEINKHE
jgi:hypothetical protein